MIVWRVCWLLGLGSVVLIWCGFSWFRGFCNLLFCVLCAMYFAGGLLSYVVSGDCVWCG